MVRLAAFLMCLALAGCMTAPGQDSQTIVPGEEVTLAPGDTGTVKNTGIRVRFVAVTEDSRCPSDTTCVQAGEVKVQLELLGTSDFAVPMELLQGGSTVAGNGRVTLVRVEPQPTSAARIAPGDYRATLKIEKAH